MENLLFYLLQNNYIEEDSINFIKYCIEVTFLNVLSILSILIVALINGNMLSGVIFMIVFDLIRTNIGGFHCKTPISCLTSFPIIYFSTVNILKLLNVNFIILLSIILLITLNYLNPVKNNTNIETSDIEKCKKQTIIISTTFILINTIYYLFPLSSILNIDYAIILACILYFIEKQRREKWL